ncbi:hypothetical protein Lal_00037192 [Lupinus albus]|nr:hypothetical protein Lal_00037192 [Lupinus albus]
MAGQLNPHLLLAVPLAPLAGSAIAGLLGTKFFGNVVGRKVSHTATILGVLIAAIISIQTLLAVLDGATYNGTLYNWMTVAGLKLEIGFMVDSLTAMMMCVVTFVSLMVHIYTIGYMAEDEGYNRFFSYISLFTFSMLMLVMSNNFLQLFFGWEAVGLVSYLLIGFWYTRPTAIKANMKAFLVNRVGDFGFILGIGLLLAYAARRAGPADPAGYRLDAADRGMHLPVRGCHGQVGPVPAARLAAGLDGRPDPDFRADPRRHHGDGRYLHGDPHVAAVRTVRHRAVLHPGDRCHHGALHGLPGHHAERHQARGGLLHAVAAGLHDRRTGCVGLLGGRVPPDDPRLLQGTAVPGCRLGHHRHAPRSRYAQHGRPAQVHAHHLDHFAAGFAGADRHPVLLGLLLQGFDHRSRGRVAPGRFGLRVFRRAGQRLRDGLLLLPHERFGQAHGHDDHHAPAAAHGVHDDHAHDAHDDHGHDEHHGLAPGQKPHESPLVVTLPLILLAIPSVIVGFFAISPMLYGDFFKGVIFFGENHKVMEELAHEYHGPVAMVLHAFTSAPLWLAIAGVVVAYYCYMINPRVPAWFKEKFSIIYTILDNKYYMDKFNEAVFAGGARLLGSGLSTVGDRGIIDGLFVNGSAKVVGWFSKFTRLWQSVNISHLEPRDLGTDRLRHPRPGTGPRQQSGPDPLAGAVRVAGRPGRYFPADPALRSAGARLPVRRKDALDRPLQHQLLPGPGRHLAVVRAADRLHHSHRGAGRLGGDPEARGPVHGCLPDPLRHHDRRVLLAGRDAVLRLLRSDPDPDVHHRGRLGRRQPCVRSLQAVPVHALGFAADAHRPDLPVLRVGWQLRDPDLAPGAAVDDGTEDPVLRLPGCLRREGADVAGTDRWLHRAGGHHAQAGCLRFPALLAADPAGRQPCAVGFHDLPVAGGRDLHWSGSPGAAGYEETGGLLVDRPHGLRHPGLLHVQRHGSAGRYRADDLARFRLRRDVHVYRHAHPRDFAVRRCGQQDAALRLLLHPVLAGQLRPAGHFRFRRRIHGDPGCSEVQLLDWPVGSHRPDLGSSLLAVAGQARHLRRRDQPSCGRTGRLEWPRVLDPGPAGDRYPGHGYLSGHHHRQHPDLGDRPAEARGGLQDQLICAEVKGGALASR